MTVIFAESNGYQVGDQITLKEGGDSELLEKDRLHSCRFRRESALHIL